MILVNKIDGVYVSLEEETGYIGETFAIYKISVTNCIKEEPVLTGEIDELNQAFFELPDGTYKFSLIPESDSLPEVKQDFLVIYNFLPVLMGYIEDALCRGKNSLCPGCDDSKLTSLNENYFKTMNYLSCIGATRIFTLMNCKSCSELDIIKAEENNLMYYGRFDYDFERKIVEFFAYLYVELYERHSNSILDTDEVEGASLESIFKVDKIKACLLRQEMKYEKLACIC